MSHNRNNLFFIDHDAIVQILQDANERLLQRIETHLEEGRKLYAMGLNDENKKDFESFFQSTVAFRKEVREARLADGRPFSDAKKSVESWFAEPEEKLKKAEDALRKELNRRLSEMEDFLDSALEQPPVQSSLGSAYDGSTIISASTRDSAHHSLSLPIEWVVEDYDLALLDLNQLKDCFTDTQIKFALKKHLQKCPPHSLPGVKYSQKIK